MKEAIVQFLIKKGIMTPGHTKWIVRFDEPSNPDVKVVDIVEIIEELIFEQVGIEKEEVAKVLFDGNGINLIIKPKVKHINIQIS